MKINNEYHCTEGSAQMEPVRSKPLFIWAILIQATMLFLQGCVKPEVYRSFSPKEADKIIVQLAGTYKPPAISLGGFYETVNKYILLDGRTYKCNHQSSIITVHNYVFDSGPGNYIQGTESAFSNCNSNIFGDRPIAGRYNNEYLYIYNTDLESTKIWQFAIDSKTEYPILKPVGSMQYRNDKLIFHKTAEDTYTVSEQTSYGKYVRMFSDPHLTAAGRLKAESNQADRQASEAAGYTRKREEEQRKSDAAFYKALGSELQAASNNFSHEMAQSMAHARGTTLEEEAAKAKRLYEFNENIRKMEADPNSDLNRDKRDREQKRPESRRAESERAARPDAQLAANAKSATHRKTLVQEGFNTTAVVASTGELACKISYENTKKIAEKWVSERKYNGSVPVNGIITDFRQRECTMMGGDPLYRRVILDITYEIDEINNN